MGETPTFGDVARAEVSPHHLFDEVAHIDGQLLD